MAAADISTIVSILPVKVDETKPGLIPSQFIIPPVVDPMTEFNIFHVSRARFPVYLDEDRPALVVPAPSDVVAESICRDYKTAIQHYEGGVAEPGLFWVPGQQAKSNIPIQYASELKRAREMQVEWFTRLVAQADDDWGQYHIRRMISGLQRTACQVLKLERDWNMEKEIAGNLKLTPCKFCRAEIHSESIVCRYCQGILDKERYRKEYARAGATDAISA